MNQASLRRSAPPHRYAGLAADTWGRDDDRAPLLLLHGLTFDRTMWSRIAAEVQRIDPDRRVVALDLPGHGQSPDWDSYDTVTVANRVHAASEEAGLRAPVVVGHSAAAGIATLYAARYATRGVVNVDGSLLLAPFAMFVRSLADRLRSPDFPAVWTMFYNSFHVDLLPPDAQHLVTTTCRPRQELVMGYWRELIETPIEDLTAMVQQALDALIAQQIPYLYVTGAELDPPNASFLRQQHLNVHIEVWPDSGHFPHLAHPNRFAARLADTANWPSVRQTPTTAGTSPSHSP